MNYWERWIGDWKKKTAHLSFEQKGAYGELLDYLYANDTATLPASKEAIYRIAGAQTAGERKAVDTVLAQESKFFILDADGYHQRRVQDELEKRAAYIEKQREMGKRRWEKKPQPAPEGAPKKAKTNGSAEGFDEFWAAYPRHESKARAQDAWDKLHPDAALRERILDAIDVQKVNGCLENNYSADNRSTIPHPASWLNGKRWEDEEGQASFQSSLAPTPLGFNCHYCSQPAIKVTNEIAHCSRLDHLDFAVARRR